MKTYNTTRDTFISNKDIFYWITDTSYWITDISMKLNIFLSRLETHIGIPFIYICQKFEYILSFM